MVRLGRDLSQIQHQKMPHSSWETFFIIEKNSRENTDKTGSTALLRVVFPLRYSSIVKKDTFKKTYLV